MPRPQVIQIVISRWLRCRFLAKNSAKFKDWGDLDKAGVTVAATLGTTQGKQVKAYFPNAEHKIVGAPARDFQEVLAGWADAHITSNVEANKLIVKYPQMMIVPVSAPKSPTPMLLPHIAHAGRDADFVTTQARTLNLRLQELSRLLANSDANDLQGLSLGDCGFPISFAWLDAFAAVPGFELEWPAGLLAYRSRIEAHSAVAAELQAYTPAMIRWLESMGV